MDYELQLERFYTRLLNEGDNAIDVGAHLGRHSIPLAKCVGINGTVLAFEPIPDINNALIKNIERENLSDIVYIYNNACSNENNEVSFTIATDLLEQSGLRARHKYTGPTTKKEITVKVQLLDDTIDKQQEKIDFIKIDVEGAEYNVLLGAKHTIEKYKPVIGFECGAASFLSYHTSADCIFQLFSSFDYVIFNILGQKFNEKEFIDATFKQNFWDYISCHRNDEKKVSAILDCINAEHQLSMFRTREDENIHIQTDRLHDTQEAENRLHTILNSRSWKITKPLRKIKTILVALK